MYGNFGQGGSFGTLGWTIGHFFGDVNQVVGQSFTTTRSLQFVDAQLAMSGPVGTSAAVYLESDNGSQPGTILDTLVEQNPIGMTPGIVTFNCRLCVTLSAGTQYRLWSAETPDKQKLTNAANARAESIAHSAPESCTPIIAA
jgi:hypothetical protein